MRTAYYTCKCGWSKTDLFERKENIPASKKCAQCGKRATREIRIASARPSRGWPLVSTAAGVYPDQVDEARETDRKLGVPCEFTPDGDRIFRDRGHRRDWLRKHHMHDHHGGYGD